MLLEISLLIGILGFGAAAYWDLKTTEFPDWVPYAIIISALGLRAFLSFTTGSFTPLISSVTTGLLFLVFGYALFFTHQWGDGDAWLIGALGFLLPDSLGLPYHIVIPYPLTVLMNFFILSFAFIIIYALALSLTRNISKGFWKYLKEQSHPTVAIIIIFLVASYTFLLLFTIPFSLLYLTPLGIIPLIIFIKYALFIEHHVFKRRIHTSKLRESDVPIGSRWRVLTPQEFKRLKASNRYIWIKEGVRLAPAFLLTFLLTPFLGNILLLVL